MCTEIILLLSKIPVKFVRVKCKKYNFNVKDCLHSSLKE